MYMFQKEKETKENIIRIRINFNLKAKENIKELEFDFNFKLKENIK